MFDPVKRFLTAGLLVVCSVTAPAQNPLESPKTKVDSSKPLALKVEVKPSFLFVALGDLRETESTSHWASDPVRRRAILNAVADINPMFVSVSGDLVLSGGSESDWQQWDRETAVFAEKKIELFPAPGNHDTHADPLLQNYFRRFPTLRQNRYYSVEAGNVLMMSLDTSLPTASGPQFDWVKDTIEHLPRKTEFVVFVMHHPPVTRSTDHLMGGGHSERPQEIAFGKWLEETQKSTRARLIVIAGHVHNYERYERDGVIYIVSGGAGATPYMIQRGPNDVYKDPGASYHYLKVEVAPGKMRISMEKLELTEGHPVWNERDSVTLTVAKGGEREESAPKTP